MSSAPAFVGASQPLLAFAATHLVASASPGPNFVLISGLAGKISRQRALIAACGTCCSVALFAGAASIGMTSVLEAAPAAAAVGKYLGASYMMWIGISVLRRGLSQPTSRALAQKASTKSIDRGNCSTARVLGRGFLVGIGNPATLAYYMSAFTLVLPAQTSPRFAVQIVVLAVLISGLWWLAVAVTFSLESVRACYSRAERVLDSVTGLAFLSFGIGFAVG